MIIRRAEKKDYNAVARLHGDGIKEGFLSMLGTDFLSNLYKAINLQNGGWVIVAECDGNVCGFIAGVVNTRGMYKKILVSHWLVLTISICRHLVDIEKLKKIFETIKYGFKNKKSGSGRSVCTAELLSIAVDGNWRGKHIGHILVDELEKKLKEKMVTEYKVVTLSRDLQSNTFYTSCNFNLVTTFVHHQNLMNEYEKKIV